MNDDRVARDLERLEQRQRRTQERLEKQQARIQERFERARQRIEKKKGRSTLNQERIVTAALELLKENGFNSLTLRDIAKRLDIKAPALYWHFRNKDQLTDYMAEAILREEFSNLTPRDNDEDWQLWLVTAMSRLRRAMLKYPDGARVVAGAHLFPAVTLAKFSDISIASLHSAGLSLQTAHDIVLTATHYTFGHVIEEQASPTAEEMARFDLANFLSNYPTLLAVSKEDGIWNRDPDLQFQTGLRAIVAGSLQI